jgi:hypothetical protein
MVCAAYTALAESNQACAATHTEILITIELFDAKLSMYEYVARCYALDV